MQEQSTYFSSCVKRLWPEEDVFGVESIRKVFSYQGVSTARKIEKNLGAGSNDGHGVGNHPRRSVASWRNVLWKNDLHGG
jgi:hypothetical protein